MSVINFWIEKGLIVYRCINPNTHTVFLSETGDRSIIYITILQKKEYNFEIICYVSNQTQEDDTEPKHRTRNITLFLFSAKSIALRKTQGNFLL